MSPALSKRHAPHNHDASMIQCARRHEQVRQVRPHPSASGDGGSSGGRSQTSGSIERTSPAIGLLPCCLCTNMWMTCAQRCQACAYAVEMLGIPLPDRNHDRAFTWESASHILWMQRKSELSTCHAAIGNK